ncbi:thymidylate kinase [Coprobacillus sp. CAG:826]|mgnify:FL=1|jgi:dTMP kinase|nr:dTMP kinase [Coprobacillus sp.]CDD91631.1 thymidylate kinase [Coprobacillus sp. CAG:826]
MFITVEGPEGSGKSSACKRIYEELLHRGYDVILTREPGGIPIAESIREIILNKKNTEMDARTEALLYAAARRQHLVQKVWPALKAGKIVLCDRFIDSSLAYQGGARGLGVDEVLGINLFATEGTLPDLTLLFDIEPEIGLARIAKNQGREVNRLDLEGLDFHHTVRNTFLDLAHRYENRFSVIDASLSEEEVYQKALQVVLEKIKEYQKQ